MLLEPPHFWERLPLDERRRRGKYFLLSVLAGHHEILAWAPQLWIVKQPRRPVVAQFGLSRAALGDFAAAPVAASR